MEMERNDGPHAARNAAAVFAAARRAWCGCAGMRQRRRRYKDFTYGRQWGDTVTTPDGTVMTEGEYASLNGKVPLTNNLIRQLVKSVVGRYRHVMASEKDSAAKFRAEVRANCLDEMDSRMMEEFLISGCAVQRIVRERRAGRGGCRVWVDNVSPERFFVNRFTDPRGWDIELVGMLHDMSLREVVMRFGCGRSGLADRIAAIYSAIDSGTAAVGAGDPEEADFTVAAPGRCRVIEVWALESRAVLRCHDTLRGEFFVVDEDSAPAIGRINSRRAGTGEGAIAVRPDMAVEWRCYMFAPDGTLLHTFLSPYAHGSHPFAVKLYPMTDGEVHPFVEDVIDQQRHVNRLITLIDHIMSYSAKGVLMFPVDQKLPEMSWREVGDRWSRCNGVIPYIPTGDELPTQMHTTGGDAGAHALLSLEMKLFEQISGVSSALSGRTTGGINGKGLNDSLVENATIALLDIFETFGSFRAERDAKLRNS